VAETFISIDMKVKKIINTIYKKATKILKDNIDKLHTMAESLLTYETIDADQIDDIYGWSKTKSTQGLG
jgi:ATP-dependent Zn proteases